MTIQLTVTVQCQFLDNPKYPADHVHSAEALVIQLPPMEHKYLQLPKLLDGLTARAIERLHNNADDYRRGQIKPAFLQPEGPPTEPGPWITDAEALPHDLANAGYLLQHRYNPHENGREFRWTRQDQHSPPFPDVWAVIKHADQQDNRQERQP